MKILHHDRNRFGWWVIVAGCAATAGCAEELGPEVMTTTSVHGTIKQADLPIRGGWIEFIPADGTVGDQRSARIDSDGSFSADRVPVGPVAIRLVDITIVPPFPLEPRAARRMFGSYPPAIRRVIPKGPSELNLELLDELIAHQARLKAAASNSGATP
jgi:hypothetical protein